MTPFEAMRLRSNGAALPALSGALAYRTASQAAGVVQYPAEEYDVGTWHDNSTNPQNFTVVSGVSLARFYGAYVQGAGSIPLIRSLLGGATYRGMFYQKDYDGGTTQNYGMSAVVSVSSGNVFTVDSLTTAVADSTSSRETWAAIEAIDPALKYALVYKSATQSITGGVAAVLSFDSEVADTDSWHSTVTQNSRLTVPSGVTRVRVLANVLDSATAGTRVVRLLKNGSTAVGIGRQIANDGNDRVWPLNVVSAVLAVSAGDYFEVEYSSATGKTISNGNETWFSIEEVPSYPRALVSKSSTQALTINVPATLTWDTEAYDTDGIFSAGSNTRLTVPSGYSYARISWGVQVQATGVLTVTITKSGSAFYGRASGTSGSGVAAESMTGVTPWVPVSAGQYFELTAVKNNNDNVDNIGATYFGIELSN